VATLLTLRTEVRRRIGETSTSFFSDAEINSLLNEGQQDFSGVGGIVEADRGFALVSNQYEYIPPTNFINAKYLLFQEKDKLHYVTPRALYGLLGEQPGQTGDPRFWTLWNKVLRVQPTPTSASDSTTLNGSINATDTTITVVSTSGFPVSGRILNESEEIQYFQVSTTEFLQCKRGQAGTTAATHASGTTANELELRLFYYKDTTDMSADGDTPDIPTEYHHALIYYAAGMLKKKDRIFDQANDFLTVYEIKKQRAHSEIRRRQRDQNPKIYPHDAWFSRSTFGIP